MNRPYSPTSRPARALLAVIACVATLFVLGSIHGLAEHYGAAVQLAGAPTVVTPA
jgi:hypothetical protein